MSANNTSSRFEKRCCARPHCVLARNQTISPVKAYPALRRAVSDPNFRKSVLLSNSIYTRISCYISICYVGIYAITMRNGC
jgi:hypothetical protein